MPEIQFTPQQRQAIETIDRSVLVSAAAGSGKTAVLAERCAYLVCDAPPGQRCDVDELVVVTFTENAAAEMKDRIRMAVRARLRSRAHDARLRLQVALVDHARISTIHAFGLWILRRWFAQAGIDPAAPVLDQHEAELLRAETLDRVFEQLYEEEGQLGSGFRSLVDDYGLGSDGEVLAFTRRLTGFLESIPDPQDWLQQCIARIGASRRELLEQLAEDLVGELEGQAEYCRRAARHIHEHLSAFSFYGDKLLEAAAALEAWRAVLHLRRDADSLAGVQAAIASFKISTRGSPRLAKDADAETLAERDRARELWSRFHDRLFKSRLLRIFGRFTPQQWFDGLDRIAPYAETLTRLAERFAREYSQAKAEAGVLDFGDLERKTYDLLNGHPDIVAALRKRFRHVLVDEFQDINPLQEAILRLVSREPDPSRADNLFVVGDVKQSIYRFRLAEPSIFLDRQALLANENSTGVCIHLQRNYRSADHILAAANGLFRSLFSRQVGGIEYDASSELRPGRETDAAEAAGPTGVEVHLLQRRLTGDADAEGDYVDPGDPSEWQAIEREAYVIAQRIRSLIGDGGRPGGGPSVGYGDVAVLLRAAAHTAAPLAQMLGSLGIPACADVGGEFFKALEVRDVLSLLTVLDNIRQDIPLAAVLRSPVLGEPLNEDELAALRLIDRDVPFHETFHLYAARGPDTDLRERVVRILRRIERYRTAARERPLPEVLWRIYHEHGYLAYVGGLPNGAARRANLLRLHEHARRFGAFQKQGLHRFLRFIESLQDQGEDLGTPPAFATSGDVVRVMSIHRSKGLEFPVVVVADLGRRFNLSDSSGRLIFDRGLGLGLRVVDRERMIEYPSLAHHLVAGNLNLHTRAEELRILYVALTRARNHLILVGSGDLDRLHGAYERQRGPAGPLPRLTISTAATPLDWIMPALGTLPSGAVEWQAETEGMPHPIGRRGKSPRTGSPIFTVHAYDEGEMTGWRLESPAPSAEKSARRAAARLAPLPAQEPRDAPPGVVAAILERLPFVYPHLPAASVPAVVAATEIRKRYDWLRDPDERLAEPVLDKPAVQAVEAPEGRFKPGGAPTGPSAAEAGVVTHRFLQHLDVAIAPEPRAVQRELRRLVALGALPPEAAEFVDFEAVACFLGTELGSRIREGGAAYRREVMFVHRQPASWLDPLVVAAGTSLVEGRKSEFDSADSVLVRGIIDGVLPGSDGLEIVDYKTDRIGPAEVEDRVRAYASQLAAYAAAAEALFRQPVQHAWLVFLSPRKIIDGYAAAPDRPAGASDSGCG